MGGWCWWWLACDGPGEPPRTDPEPSADHSAAATAHTGVHTGAPDPTGDSATTTDVPLELRCALQPDNALRVECLVSVDVPQPVELRFRKVDGTGVERVRRSDTVADRHALTLWFLAPDTDYAVTATSADGAEPVEVVVRTGTLPLFADVRVRATGTSSAGLFLSTSPCPGGAAVVWDPNAAEVLWYQQLNAAAGAFLEGVSLTDEGTLLGLAQGTVVEVDWTGATVRTLAAGVDLPNYAHHDAFKRNGLTYVIFQEQPPGWDVWSDGFYVFDSVGLSWEWHLADFASPSPGGPNPLNDWSHANGVWADATGDVLVSFRHLSGVVKVEGDPLDPEFGQVSWRLSGEGDSDLGSDFTLVEGAGLPGFQQQHNPHVLSDGTLTLFDNRRGFERSRILDLALDEGAGTATVTRIWDVPGNLAAGGHCDFQGSALRTAAGNPVATCAPFRTGTEYDAVTGDVVWTGSVACGPQGGSYVPRFVPFEE